MRPVNLTFEKALELTDHVSTRAAYEIEALRGLWFAAISIPRRSTILEIGCEYGRSASLLAQVAKEQGHRLVCIDPFLEESCAPVFLSLMRKIQPNLVLGMMTTQQWVNDGFACDIGLLHIDGDHSRESVQHDCYWFCPKVYVGGYVVFHDYDGGGTPDVKSVVDSWMNPREWFLEGVFHTCAVYRRLC